MAKKMDKAVKGLAKELKKLRKENEKLAKSVEKTRKDQAESHRELRDLLEERLTARDATDETDDHTNHDEDGGFVTAETAEGGDSDTPETLADAQEEDREEPEVTAAAERRAKELSVDPTGLKGTGSGGRVLVKDVEAAAGE